MSDDLVKRLSEEIREHSGSACRTEERACLNDLIREAVDKFDEQASELAKFAPIDGNRDNTSLKNWFPISAEQLKAAERQLSDLRAEVAGIKEDAAKLKEIASRIMNSKGSYDCKVDPRVQAEYEKAYSVIRGISEGTGIYTIEDYDAAMTKIFGAL